MIFAPRHDSTALGPFLAKLSARGETRRVRLPRDIDWPAFTQLIQSLFPHLVDKDFTVTYTDEEGDEISLSTTEELREALVLNEQLDLPKCLSFSIDSNDLSDAASIASWSSSVVHGPILEPVDVHHDLEQISSLDTLPEHIPLPPSPCISPDVSFSSPNSPDIILAVPATTPSSSTPEPASDGSDCSDLVSKAANSLIDSSNTVSPEQSEPKHDDNIIPVIVIPSTPASRKSQSIRASSKSNSIKSPRLRTITSTSSRPWPYTKSLKKSNSAFPEHCRPYASSINLSPELDDSYPMIGIGPLTDILNSMCISGSPFVNDPVEPCCMTSGYHTHHPRVHNRMGINNRQQTQLELEVLARERLHHEKVLRHRRAQLEQERLAQEYVLFKQREHQLHLAQEAARRRALAERQAAYWAQTEQAARLRALCSPLLL